MRALARDRSRVPTVLITGCSSGIGLDAARTMAARGWTVIATCRKPEDLAARAAEGMIALPLDLADPASVEAAVDAALEHLLTRGLRTIWMQIGVVDEAAAARAGARGVNVVMNRCPKIEYQRLFGELRMGGFNTGIISSKR